MNNKLVELRENLQQAIELEHATIPLYLTALWSLKPGANEPAREALRAVVVEEMLHMALACNILNAVGGQPEIDHGQFVPRYPGPLPHGVRPDLTARLRAASVEHIRDTFMEVEEPHLTLDPAHPGRPHHNQKTIGQFYHQIGETIRELGDSIFTGDPRKQVTDWRGTGTCYAVTDVESAEQAIEEIIEQGEGAGELVPEDSDAELAHFYRFQEVAEQRRLVHDGSTWTFTGEAIPFDPEGVWPIMDDPLIATIAHTDSRAAVIAFNQEYTSMLQKLHEAFNGNPPALDEAIGGMFRLSAQAVAIMGMPSGQPDGRNAAPSFELA